MSEGVADDLKEIGVNPGLIQVIHNPVVTPDLIERAKEPIDHPWFAPVNRLLSSVLVGWCRKGLSNVASSVCPGSTAAGSPIDDFGEGPDRSALEAQIQALGLSENVLLPGFVSNPYAYLAKASLFVLSSRFEGLPTVLIEAMAIGTSVVATACKSGPAEILARGHYGPLVDVGNIDELAAAINQTLKHPTPPSLLQARALEYSLEQSLNQYASILKIQLQRPDAAPTYR